MLQYLRRVLARRLIPLLVMLIGSLSCAYSAQAAVVSAGQMQKAESQAKHLQHVQTFLARADVASNLIDLGVDAELAKIRVQNLSAEELAELSGEIERLPAGGIFEVLGIVLVVLIVLEILGVTNIFTRL